jgi:hypothetical protein
MSFEQQASVPSVKERNLDVLQKEKGGVSRLPRNHLNATAFMPELAPDG